MNINEVKATRASKIAEMRVLSDHASQENRALSENERSQFDSLESEINVLNNRLTYSEKLAEFERLEAGAEPNHNVRSRDMRSYSLAKAMRESGGDCLTGCEAEWHAELSQGRSEVRGVMIPTEIILVGETRAVTTTTPGAGPGSNLIATDLAKMTDRRRAALKVESMGATILRNLTGNFDLPRLKSSGTAGWTAEHAAASRSDAKFEKTSMSPKTVSAEYEVSRRMMIQSNEALENILRSDLSYLLAQALDSAAIRGGGTDEPSGVLETTGVASVTGGSLDSDIAAELIAALETDNVTGTAAFLTNPAVMKAARKKKDADEHVIPMSELFHGERVETSTQVPGNIGTGSDKNALIYGEWASLYIGYWSGIDLLTNPYHSDVASKGGALLHAFLDADVVVRHPEGFRYAEID